jgi:hypothetical protein
MNFVPLFTTTRVVVSVYRLASTAILLYYLVRRRRDRREFPRDRRGLSFRPRD